MVELQQVETVPRPSSGSPSSLLGYVGLLLLALLVGVGSASAGPQALLPIFGIVVLAVIVARPEYGIAIFLSTFLMAYPGWLQGSGYLTLNNVLGGIFAVLLTYKVYREQDWWFLRAPEVQLLLLIVVMYYLSETFNSPDPLQVSLLGAGFYFAEGLRIFVNRVAFTLFFINFIRTPGHVRMIFMLALGFMMVTALTGVQTVLLGGGLKGYRAFTGAEDLVAGQAGLIRAAGNPNRLAMFAVIAITGVWFLIQSVRIPFVRLLGMVAIVLLSLAVFLAASRSGLIGLALCGFLIVADGGLSVRKIGTILLGALLLSVMVVQFVPERSLERITNIPLIGSQESDEGEASIERRSYAWEVAYELWKENPPFLGVGMGNWSVARFLNDPARSAGAPHNSHLLALIEGGVLVLLAFWALIWRTWRNLRIAEHYVFMPGFPLAELGWVVKATRVSLIIFVFFTLVADLYNLVLLFMLVGLGVVVRRQVDEVVQRQSLSY